MTKKIFVRIYRFIFGLIILVAITTQFLTFRQSTVNFFSYFTILSNLIAAFVFLYAPFTNISTDKLRGASLLYVLLTGIGFVVLLGGRNTEFVSWVNIVLHYLSPIVMLIDWVVIKSKNISFKQSLHWLLFLAVYLIYCLSRGFITGWYPYSFLDPLEVGYSGVIAYTIILTLSSLSLLFAITRLTSKTL